MKSPFRSQPPIFVINRKQDGERREKVTAQLTDARLQFELFPATDGLKLAAPDLDLYDEDDMLRQISRTLSSAEIGCYLSHRRVWQRIISADTPWAVILEDDVIVNRKLKTVLRQIDKLPLKWDVIRLSGLIPTSHVKVSKLTDDFSLTVPLQGPSGAQAMCISKNGALKLLAYSTRIRGTVDDHVIDNWWRTGIKLLAVQPYPIWEDRMLVSTIQGGRLKVFEESRGKIKNRSIKQQLRRRRYKLNRSLDRRVNYLINLVRSVTMRFSLST